MNDRHTQIARQFIEIIPHAKALHMTLTEIGDGRAEIVMPYDARLVGDPATGVIHGGAVSVLMDTCGGAAATLDLRIDYMRGAVPGKALRAQATCYHVTRSIAFVRALATDDESETPVATATGAFTLERGSGA